MNNSLNTNKAFLHKYCYTGSQSLYSSDYAKQVLATLTDDSIIAFLHDFMHNFIMPFFEPYDNTMRAEFNSLRACFVVEYTAQIINFARTGDFNYEIFYANFARWCISAGIKNNSKSYNVLQTIKEQFSSDYAHCIKLRSQIELS